MLIAKTSLKNIENYLLNGGFWFSQRYGPSAVSLANAVYGPDRWYVLGDSGATDISVTRASLTAPLQYCGQIKNGNASSKHVGLAQIIESYNTIPLVGRTVSFQCSLSTTSSTNARMAILAWTNSADSVNFGGTVPRDPVASWLSPTYTAGNFFQNTSLSVVAVSPSLSVNTTATVPYITGTVPSNAKNLVVMVWTESAVSNAGSTNISNAGLYDGTDVQPWLPRCYQQELAACQRYCVQYGGAGGYETFGLGTCISTTAAQVLLTFPVPMRAVPTISNPGGNSNLCVIVPNVSLPAVNATPTIQNGGVKTTEINCAVGSATLVSGALCILASNNTANANLVFDAEL